MGISAIILTKNEETKIKGCLISLKGLVDEIIVVDDYSTDNTVEICRKYGARVFRRNLNNDFASQRNFGIEKAKGEWILQMDADEIVPVDTVKKIQEMINNSKGSVAFELRRRNFLFDYPLRYGGSYNYGIKLIKKGKAYYKGRVHEQLLIDGKVGKINADIYHYPFSSLKSLFDKANFYTDIEAEEFVKERNNISFQEIKYRLTWKSLKLFWKLYVKKKGYKDGMYGLVWCILNVIGPQIKWLKIWERGVKEGKLGE